MSLIHYEPDTSVVPCLGCDELVGADDLVRSERVLSSSIFWYPYHFWCIREGAPVPRPLLECAECGARLDLVDVRTALHWAATFVRRVRRRLIAATLPGLAPRDDPAAVIPRPPGLRCVSVGVGPELRVEPTGVFEGDDLEAERRVAGWFELAHDDCPDADEWWLHVRDAPGDDELRLVYADWLEQRGELERAAVVRLAVQRRRCDPAARGELSRQLREAGRPHRGSWIRDVCAGGAPTSGRAPARSPRAAPRRSSR